MRRTTLLMALFLAGCRSRPPVSPATPEPSPPPAVTRTPAFAPSTPFPRPPPPQWTPGPGQSQSVPLTEKQLKVERAIANAKRMAAEGQLEDAEDLLDDTRDEVPEDGRLTFMLWSAATQMSRPGQAFTYGGQYRSGYGGKFTPEPDKLAIVDRWFKDHTAQPPDPDDDE